MTRDDPSSIGCGCATGEDRCAAVLPDNPACGTHFHFGLLLGVDEFRAEQGFHLGRARRHQRLLHGAGVVAGYPVAYDGERQELRVGAGFAVDAAGRDLALDRAQCLSLPRWWLQQRDDDLFGDVPNPEDATLDLELVVRHHACLSHPVPAIADPCAGARGSIDVAYARVCETVRLELRRARSAAAAAPSHRLLRVWLGLEPAAAEDAWLLGRYAALLALPAAEQPAARARLLREVLAHAVAAESVAPPTLPPENDADGLPLCLARLPGVRLQRTEDGWLTQVPAIELADRPVLLPTALLQSLLAAEPAPQTPAAGPVVQPGGATLAGTAPGTDVTVVFNQPLEPASVGPGSLAVSEFVPGSGWAGFALTAALDNAAAAGPTVTLRLDRAPDAAALLRLTVVGNGATPLLGSHLIAAGAPHPGADGRLQSVAIERV
jgi:hypothetical protein